MKIGRRSMTKLLAGTVPAAWMSRAWAWQKPRSIAPGVFQPTWDSLKQYQAPQWFRDAKFGIWVTSYFIVLVATLGGTSAWCAGPTLTPEQIQAAIQNGAKYKTVDNFLDNGLRGKRVKLASAMAVDGISKYATFFNDWQFVAAESAAAHQQMRELKPEEIHTNGLLHAYVEVHARGAIPTSKLNRRYREQRAHLVLKIGERIVQPIDKTMIKKSDQSVPAIFAGFQEGKIILDFAFDVSPEDLQNPVTVILIDGDGNRHQQKADLKGILDID